MPLLLCSIWVANTSLLKQAGGGDVIGLKSLRQTACCIRIRVLHSLRVFGDALRPT